ncbi:hypothetical protein IMZ48_21435 [Candidatus Bathyarchaeota archaeon]|nr:hypothetical protein [Candidatus Bathyarchaeota archaeon]
MEDLSARYKALMQSGETPPAVLEALAKFVTSEPRRVIPPSPPYGQDELEERMTIGRKSTEALMGTLPTMEKCITPVFWSLIMCAPIDTLRSSMEWNSELRDICVAEMIPSRLGIMMKLCELLHPPTRICRVSSGI